MKLTKELEAEVLKAYHTYWDSYLKGDMETFASMIDENCHIIGSTMYDIFSDKKSAVEFYTVTAGQIAGKSEFRNRKIQVLSYDESVMVEELCDFYFLGDEEWNFYGHGRMSTLLNKKETGWKIIHQHGSMPDSKAEEGEQVGTEKINQENRELREAVKRRTVELEHKNRELAIEAALERVRAVAMSMNKAEDMLLVCQTISEQLETLGTKEIRNVQTAIFNPAKETYINYEFYRLHDKSLITEVDYTTDKMTSTFASNMQKGAGEFFTESLTGKGLNDWFEFQKTTPQFADPHLEEASSLNYYWFSLGPIALGISTYAPLNEEEINLFKRFRNVFELSYRRFLDITKAEAQAREAQIELALERVRVKAMAMQASEELNALIGTVFTELTKLDLVLTRCVIMIYDPELKFSRWWMANSEAPEDPASFYVQYHSHPPMQAYFDAWKTRELKYTYILESTIKKNWDDFLFNETGLKELPGFVIEGMKQPDKVYLNASFNNFGNLTLATLEPLSDSHFDILLRFAKVFDLTYARFNDIQVAEAQAREAQIQLAMERVRARTMAMQHSSELAETSFLMAKQVRALGIEAWGCAFNIFDENADSSTEWFSNEDAYLPTYKTPRKGIFRRYYEAALRGEELYIEEFKGEVCTEHYRFLCSIPVLGDVLRQLKESGISFPSSQIDHVVFFKHGYLLFITYEPVPEAYDIFKRFAKVFEQTYTRFLDLQKAEAQAKESLIQLALERVRARTMAMQHSDELQDAASLLFKQVEQIGTTAWACGYNIWGEDKKTATAWMSAEGRIQPAFETPSLQDVYRRFYEADQRGESFYTEEIGGEELVAHYRFLRTLPVVGDIITGFDEKGISLPTVQIFHICYFAQGYLIFITYKPVPELWDIFKRFAKVFEQTYTRFLDLQKAEAQARQAQIEAGLEKIRSRTMAMQKSDELLETSTVLYKQLKELNVIPGGITIGIINEEETGFDLWITGVEGIAINQKFSADIQEPLMYKKAYNSWKQQQKNLAVELTGSDLSEFMSYLKRIGFPVIDNPANRKLVNSFAFFSHGYISIISPDLLPPETIQLLEKFSAVFDLTYTRFLDLKKAEAQTKEAHIEAALERVRSKAMAMHNTQNLSDTIHVFYKELKSFSITPRRCGVGLLHKETRIGELYTWNTTEEGNSLELVGFLKMEGHPILDKVYENWLTKTEYHPVLKGNEIKEYYSVLRPQISFPDYEYDAIQYGYFFFFNEGGVYAWTDKEMTEDELQIYRRFTSVLSLTYNRYTDLKRAEEQAREANIEAALERVRSRTLAMQKSAELAETAAVVFRQLILLGIAPNRLYIGIIKDDEEHIEFWVTDEDGTKVNTQFIGETGKNTSMKKLYDAWKEQARSLTIDMQGEELTNYFHYLSNELKVPFKHGLSQKRRIQSAAYFGKGFIGMASPDPQPEETMNLLERFAAVFNLTYTRFNDLQIAEAHAIQAEEDLIKLQTEKKRAEEALSELRATQTQLIQSEKMASLGELTAGIAHEIQNPLNFVNNFSELSNELLDEMLDEVTKGNYEQAKAIVDDIKQNLEKINHHGKRADGIVKGMLQHSRSSSGQKDPTDINLLADEYLRLAYHGLRAKDKSFNATLKTDYDESIDKITIIPQDIGRVMLNIITNAFYAVTEKKKLVTDKYEPTVSVITKRNNETISVTIKDNGNGIPAKLMDKIFQPFFTTKPTGQGTGLGLSLAYDIVKAHGGEIKVNTKEFIGTEFSIHLPSN